MAAKPPNEAQSQARPEIGDILIVIHDFQARSSDELSLAKGDRVELLEPDDEFGDGWFLGKQLCNGNSGLFPEVYTRPAPKPSQANAAPANTTGNTTPSGPLMNPQGEPASKPVPNERPASAVGSTPEDPAATPPPPAAIPPQPSDTPEPPVTLPLNSVRDDVSSLPVPATSSPDLGALANASQDSQVLHDTLNVIDEHITNLRSPPSTSALRVSNDSDSEYSAQLDPRMSYIQGEETDEEEESTHTRAEVLNWTPDQVAEHLFTAGVEKHHCEVFRDQEISGEVLLGMDQSSLFIKAFDLGSVGRRLKTWQKIKALQDECDGQGPPTRRTTQTYGSEAGSEDAWRARSRAGTLTNSIQRLPPADDRPASAQAKGSFNPMEPSPLVSPTSTLDSPTRATHTKRPSAASIRDLNHSRRHSSTDFRASGTPLPHSGTPKIGTSGTFPLRDGAHKKEPSFDRNWSMGNAFSSPRPLSSTGLQDAWQPQQPNSDLQDSAVDLDRGYFSGTEAEGKRRNVLRKRDSGAHSRKSSYADEQRMRSGTALSRHSRYGSIDASREGGAPSPAAQKYYGIQPTTHVRPTSTSTTRSARRVPSVRESQSPTVTKLDGSGRDFALASGSSANRQVASNDWLSGMVNKPFAKAGGLRAISDTSAGDRFKAVIPSDSPLGHSPMPSPARTGSSTPSAAPSLDIDSPDTTKSPSIAGTTASKGSRKKSKKETSAYQRGLQRISPREAMKDADYSGWMKKKSSNLMTTWKPRLFVLKGRRLAYFYSEDDDQEKGLIDISFHRVLPADNEKLTGLHATLTGAGSAPTPSTGATLEKGDDSMFIFKLVPPRSGLSRAVNFTKPTVHYFAVPNLQQGRLWMAALMKATIDRDDAQPVTTTYQQKTISLAKARAMRHRPPALMNLDEGPEDEKAKDDAKLESNYLGINFGEADSGVSGLEKLVAPKVESASFQKVGFAESDTDKNDALPPQTA
ncbi:hypothetical protein SODALDRAFT_353267 [Sodiomyces alkalinus F11]|uniref:Polarized growth protein Boi2 n=1 Tax=Sodiomyces alkalinus (strain CBS 110278 / VKM F-3762 / F11) TaxID=1314773 RepID=A0A3N2PM64_SODAK|nr:hypothetical protein SODALDRAFT_353267 [Sodiomyces alkalinus F11]ROT35622.1 hypothetical protein SODALDRAFT_353267 [Sodiomyces alkalinus F11]